MATKRKINVTPKVVSKEAPAPEPVDVMVVPVDLVEGLIDACHRGAKREVTDIASEFIRLAQAQDPVRFPE